MRAEIIAVTLIEGLIFYAIFLNISQLNFKLFELIGTALATIFLALAGHHFAWTVGIAPIVVNVIFILAASSAAYIKSKNMPLSFLFAIMSSLVFLLVGNIQMTLAYLLIGQRILQLRVLSVTLGAWQFFLLDQVIWALLAVPIAYFVGGLIHQKLITFPKVLVKRFCMYIIIGACISFFLFALNIFLSELIVEPAWLNLFNTLFMSVYFLYLVFAIYTFANNFRNEDEMLHNKEMLKNLEIYTHSIEEAHTELRQFKHDHRNILVSMYEHIENNNVDGIRAFFKEYVLSFEESSFAMESTLSKLQNIQIPEIKSILSQKLMYAQQLGITVHIEVSDIIDDVDFDRVSFYRVVGILIDNSIESCLESNSSVLKFAAFKKENDTSLLFINTYGTSPPISKIFNKDFTTKEKNKGRGLGLYTLRLILDKNNNVELITSIEGDDFIQHLIIS